MNKFQLQTGILGYMTSPDETTIPGSYLVSGSKNVLINRQKKFGNRAGYSRLGAANTALTPVLNSFDWLNNTGGELPMRFYDDELEVYLGTIDAVAINAWTRVKDAIIVSPMIRFAKWWDTGEDLDLLLFVIGDSTISEWGGGVAKASSVSVAQVAEAGDAANQLSAWAFTGVTSSNSNAFVLYWRLTDAAGTRTVDIYKDSGGANRVATGSRSGDGSITLTADGGSGLTGSVTVAYTADDTTISANTLTITYTVTKQSTNTWKQNRFYSTRNKTFINRTDGQEFTYTGGETTTTLTGVTPTTSMNIVSGDTLMQKVVVRSNAPASGYGSDTIYVFNNHLFVGSDDNSDTYMSQNDSYYDFTFSAPRVAGEGDLFTLDNPCKAFGALSGKVVMFAGRNDRYVLTFTELAVSTTLAESTSLEKFSGTNQSARSQEVVTEIGNALAYLSFEPALYILDTADALKDPKPNQVSNPIKPDFDAEDWTNAYCKWGNSRLHLSAPVNSRLYILEYLEDEQGKLIRFWQPPQLLPIRSIMEFDGDVHFHSNAVPETYKLFDQLSDGYYDGIPTEDKFPIQAVAKRAYFNGGKRANLKNFDEFYIEGEISRNTIDLKHTINYELGGAFQQINNTIDGTDLEILFESIEDTSLGQQNLGQIPLGGAINQASDTAKFRVIFEIAKDDFYEIQEVFETNEVDRAWTILSSGPNATISTRQDSVIKR